MPKNFEKEIKAYFENVFARNEFIFSRAVQESFVKKVTGAKVDGDLEFFEKFVN